jgi:hypothetical protein
MVCLLINTGHHGCLDYGYSFFVTACKMLDKFQKQQILSFTTAIGLAFGSKAQVDKFLKDK